MINKYFSWVLLMNLAMATTTWCLSHEAEAIRGARLAQNAAMAKGDLNLIASFWTDDVTARRALGASIVGKEDYKAHLLLPASNATSLLYSRIPDDIEVSPNWPLAYESGTWQGGRGSQSSPVFQGRYAAQWVKRDGRWLIRSEVFVALDCFEEPCPPAVP